MDDLPPITHRNLELTQTLRGEDSPTLLSLVDTCRTGMGSRALRQWMTHPLRERTVASHLTHIYVKLGVRWQLESPPVYAPPLIRKG